MAMAYANGRYASKHVQIPLAPVIEQPLHSTLVKKQRFVVHLSLGEHVLQLHTLCSLVAHTLNIIHRARVLDTFSRFNKFENILLFFCFVLSNVVQSTDLTVLSDL